MSMERRDTGCYIYLIFPCFVLCVLLVLLYSVMVLRSLATSSSLSIPAGSE